MIKYWSAFATKLNPNQKNLPHWPAFNLTHPVRLILEETISEKTNLDSHCDFWDSVGYDLRGVFKRI